MANYAFDIVIKLPEGRPNPHDHIEAIQNAIGETSVINVEQRGFLAVDIEWAGNSLETAVLSAARTILKGIPGGKLVGMEIPDQHIVEISATIH